MKKLLEMYQEKVMKRKEKQKENIKEYVMRARVKRVAERLQPYREEIFQMLEKYGTIETRKIINISLGMKMRASLFNEVIHYLKQEPQNSQNSQKK